MTIYYSDEDTRLTPEIRSLMEKAFGNAMRLEFGEELLAEAGGLETGVTIVGSDEIRELNRDYRGIDAVTDVLSFPQYGSGEEIAAELGSSETEILLGDVVICYDRAMSQAEEYGTGATRELVYLFVHSILHLLGYDHEDEEERGVMRSREEEIMDMTGVSR